MSKFMRVVVFFDMPVTTKEERKVATQFRKFLLDDGYYMLQYSVYVRLCGNVESADDVIKRLNNAIPSTDCGSVRCMVVTEKQYSQMQVLAGKKKLQENPVELYQMSFL